MLFKLRKFSNNILKIHQYNNLKKKSFLFSFMFGSHTSHSIISWQSINFEHICPKHLQLYFGSFSLFSILKLHELIVFLKNTFQRKFNRISEVNYFIFWSKNRRLENFHLINFYIIFSVFENIFSKSLSIKLKIQMMTSKSKIFSIKLVWNKVKSVAIICRTSVFFQYWFKS